MTFSATLLLDLVGTLVFGLSGALVGVRKDGDIFGMAVLAVAAGLGGGLVRDVLLGQTPPAAIRHEAYVLTALTAALLTFVFHPGIERLRVSIQLFDALGLGFFAVAGTLKSLHSGLDPMPAVLLGVVTGVGGGVIRDVLVAEVPLVLRRDVYALAALAGATLFAVLVQTDIPETIAAALGVAITFALRMLAVHFDWQAPRPRR